LNQPGGTSPNLIAIVTGVIVAVIAIALFIPIDVMWKMALIVVLILVVVADILSNLHWLGKIRYKRAEQKRASEIMKHPDLINDLLRLNQRLHEVLYENRSGHSSLKIQGEAVMKELSRDNLVEFNEKIKILEGSFQLIYNRVYQHRSSNHRWNSFEFTEAVSNVDSHLALLEVPLNTIYRSKKERPSNDASLLAASRIWNNFRDEYNPVINEWQSFVGRVSQTVGIISESSQAKVAQPL